MARIGIFGSENSHAMAFSEIFNLNNTEYDNFKVVAIGGEDSESTKKIVDKCGVEQVAAAPAEMIGNIDAGMVTSRDGGLHLKYARTFIEAGLPTFVDKPVTNSEEDAVELIKLAKSKNVPLVGGSSVKLLAEVKELGQIRAQAPDKCVGGYICAPLNMNNPYGGFYFYTAHLAEVCLGIFGMNPVSVDAYVKNDNVMAVVHYDNFDVACHFINGLYTYGAVLQMSDKTYIREMSLDGCYKLEVDEYVKMVKTGHMPATYEEMIQHVYLINAVKRSYETGTNQKVGTSIK